MSRASGRMPLMLFGAAPLYDATTGFHDIKALPTFSAIPAGSALIAAIGAFALYILWRLLSAKPETFVPAPTPVSPEQAAFDALDALERRIADEHLDSRTIAAELSLILRNFLEARLHFPASEQTRKEVLKDLRPSLKAQLPALPKALAVNTSADIDALLKTCERAAFAAESRESGDFFEAGRTVEGVRGFVRRLTSWLQKEAERRQPVVSDQPVEAET